LHQLASSFVLG
jgi:hypothetical protein